MSFNYERGIGKKEVEWTNGVRSCMCIQREATVVHNQKHKFKKHTADAVCFRLYIQNIEILLLMVQPFFTSLTDYTIP